MHKDDLRYEEKESIVVISIIGKDSTTFDKTSELNEAFGVQLGSSTVQDFPSEVIPVIGLDLDVFFHQGYSNIRTFRSYELGAIFLLIDTFKDISRIHSVTTNKNGVSSSPPARLLTNTSTFSGFFLED